MKTDRLIINPISEKDFEDVYKVQSHPEVTKYLGNGLPKSKGQAHELFEKLLVHQKKHGYSLWPTYEKESGAFIGFSGLIHLELNDENPEVEVGYWFLPEFWGKGYATEVTKAWVDWGFDTLSLDKVVAVTQPDHVRSQRVLEKSGFSCLGESTYLGINVFRFEKLNSRQ